MAEKKKKQTNETETAEETPVETTPEEPVAEADAPAEEPAAEVEVVTEETPAEPAEEPVAEVAPAEEPVAEVAKSEDAAAEPAAEEPAAEAAPAPQSGPKPKRKRVPRALRPQKTRPKRVKATERKPIVRLEKPEHERGRSQERLGTVVSDAMDKTIVVKVDVIKSHRKYKKVVRRSVKFHAHDERNSAHVGDTVRIVETRPLSATKRWRLTEIVEVAK
jgi:small subunit ribosomal protein S17